MWSQPCQSPQLAKGPFIHLAKCPCAGHNLKLYVVAPISHLSSSVTTLSKGHTFYLHFRASLCTTCHFKILINPVAGLQKKNKMKQTKNQPTKHKKFFKSNHTIIFPSEFVYSCSTHHLHCGLRMVRVSAYRDQAGKWLE